METIKKYIHGIVLSILYIILSLFIYKDYGVAWDEFVQREIGIVSYDYIVTDSHVLDTYLERDHGTGFEMPLIAIERALGLTDSRDIYHMRHLVTHLFFLVGCFLGYVLCFRLFRNNVIACLGFLMFAFHPRIFAHSFFNTKDVPFLSAFLITLCIAQIAFDKNKWYWYALAGVACGYAASIRIPGVLLCCIIVACFLADMVSDFRKKRKVGNVALNSAVFLTSFCLTLYSCFPTLWQTPLKSLVEVFESMSHFRWSGGVLFNGQIIMADNLPWTYIPVWFSITMPITWLVLGALGIIWFFVDFIRKPSTFLENNLERNFGIYFLCCLIPVAAIIVMKSVVYDDWRHVYFVYPSFVVLCLYTVDKLYKRRVMPVIMLALSVEFITLVFFMIGNHPYQQVYFNRLITQEPEALRYRYDQDYWFSSMKQGLEYILKSENRDDIKIHCPLGDPMLVSYNIAILPPKQRGRLRSTGVEEADYIIVNFRDHRADYQYGDVFYEVKVNKSTILRVYKVYRPI